MAVSVVQSAQSAAFGDTAAFGGGTAAGNAVVIAALTYISGSGTIDVTGAALGGTAATLLQSVQSSSSGTDVAGAGFWIVPDVTAGQTALSFTPSGTTQGISLFAWEVSGLGTAPALDQQALNSATSGTAVTSGTTPAITGAPELILGAAALYGVAATSPGAPWEGVLDDEYGFAWAGYQIAGSSGGTYSWSQAAGGSTEWAALVLTLSGNAATLPPPAVTAGGRAQSRLAETYRFSG